MELEEKNECVECTVLSDLGSSKGQETPKITAFYITRTFSTDSLVKSWYKEPGIKEINYGNLIVRNVSRYDVPEFSAIDYIIKAAKR